ncbi:peptide/nickel transport system substrate-binding protein [Micromonospora pallida]|uniref:Peptide/nickel transport system substrate-binding protein n=1 Tax=Micromonospora pallida TaxID=145854 RepID=A0A1C6RS52_9ACTN|nr:ABC transporter substrate-binding protein [Micromonospora pallida]SCL19998.1 peptide/nickel transport system substrate-binding protein [Micromonospora pallida]
MTARRLGAGLAVLAIATPLAACTSGSGGEPLTTRSSATAAIADYTDRSMRVGIASLSTSDTLDPAKITTSGGYAIASQLYDTLTVFSKTGAVEPSLATSVEAGDNAATWTVTLRDDAKWQDGSPVTADDVLFTLDRIFDKKLPPASSLPFVDPKRIDKVDDHTLTFHLKYPTSVFAEAFATPTLSIVPKTFDAAKPIGSGPFKLGDYTAGNRVTFTANQDYWGDGPHTSGLELISFADAAAEAKALIGGQIDVASGIDATQAKVIHAAGGGLNVQSYATSGTLTWVMNVKQKPFDNPVARQALRLAVDRQQLIDQVYDGYATIGNDYFSPFDPLYNKDLPQRTPDAVQAKSMLEKAGFTLPVKVELVGAPTTAWSNAANELLVQQGKAAGFDITFKKVDESTFYGDGYGTYPLSLSYWGFLGIFNQAAFTVTKDAPYNSSHWQDDEFNTAYDKAVRSVDPAEQKTLVAQMQKIEYDRGAYLVPAFLDSISAYAADVSGYSTWPNTDGGNGYHFAGLGFIAK